MKYIVAIDQSTSGSKGFLVDENGDVVRRLSLKHAQFYPKSGYVEHDANEIYENVVKLIDGVTDGIDKRDIQALALANQRETSVIWDRKTGLPLCNAIVWQDVRGEKACAELKEYDEYIHTTTGLNLSPYYPAGKIRALFEERPDIRQRAQNGEVRIGTIDSYLLWRLAGADATDTTNAGRTQLMRLDKLEWDKKALDIFEIPSCCMAEKILPADAEYGFYKGIPVTGVMGDSHGSLFGLGCLEAGMAKTSYGTGSSVLMNTGFKPIISDKGLTTSVAFSYGGKTYYVLEGNVTSSGDTLVWLCSGLGLFKDPAEIEQLARSVQDSDGVQLVPAMSGLGAPYFDTLARAVLCGMNRGTTKAHVAYAGLASIAQQITDILEVMNEASGYKTEVLRADGGGSRNSLLVQLQADLAGCSVSCATADEITGLGVAYVAGLKTGMYKSFAEIPANARKSVVYNPAADRTRAQTMRAQWKTAIRRTMLK